MAPLVLPDLVSELAVLVEHKEQPMPQFELVWLLVYWQRLPGMIHLPAEAFDVRSAKTFSLCAKEVLFGRHGA